MRIARRFLKTVYLRRRVEGKDAEANVVNTWADPVELHVNVQPAGGTVNAQMYGEELNYMKSILYQGDEIKEDRDEMSGIDFASPLSETPDYEIESIATHSDHLVILVKKVNHG